MINKKIGILLISLFSMTTTFADNMYFQITNPSKPGEKIVIWSMLHAKRDCAMNFSADDQSRVMCEGWGCKLFKIYAHSGRFPSYTELWNKIATCSSKEKWQLYLEVNDAGGSKTYPLDTTRAKQLKENQLKENQAINNSLSMIMNPI